MPTFKNNRKFGCIILAERKERLRISKAIGKNLLRLSRRSMMSFSASRRHQNIKRRSFILIDLQPIMIGNFFCSTHGYFEPWFFPWDTGQMPGQEQRWGTTVYQLPTCVQELPTRLYPPMITWWYPRMTIPHFKRRVLWLDESRINPLKSRQFQKDFKMISRCLQEFKIDQFMRRALWLRAKDQPAWRWCHFDSVLEEENYSLRDGPFGRVRRINPLEEDTISFVWS